MQSVGHRHCIEMEEPLEFLHLLLDDIRRGFIQLRAECRILEPQRSHLAIRLRDPGLKTLIGFFFARAFQLLLLVLEDGWRES